MTGSAALDVVIGLVFIYLLYSLLASIIQEIIASFLGLRARNLKHGISRMLEDASPRKKKTILEDMVIDSKESYRRTFSSNEDGLLKKFYEQPVIKYLASSRYFSKPSYIGKSDFSKAIIDILKKGNEDVGISTIDKIKIALSDETNSINEETRDHIKSLLDDAQNDLVKFKANLEDWFNSTMERVAGWYKRTTQFVLLIIGFVLAISFNVNTIEITQLLSSDKDARDQMVNLASAYVTENKELTDLYLRDQKTTQNDSIVSENDSAKIDFNTKLDSLLKIKGKLEADIEGITNILGFRPVDRLVVEKKLTVLEATSKKNKLSPKEKIIDDYYLVKFPSAYLADKTHNYYKIVETKVRDRESLFHAEFKNLSYIWDNLWGYLITALAISLGAPFWFDLLNKLIKMRTSIQKNPENSSGQDGTQQGAVPTNQRVG